MSARALWSELAEDLACEFDDRYEVIDSRDYQICLKQEAVASSDKRIVRFRTMEASIRRRQGRPTLLDLSVGNLFSLASASPPERLHVVNDPKYAFWARHAGQVSLSDHVRLIGEFTTDLMDAGWRLEHANLRTLKILPPVIRNGHGVQPLPIEKFAVLAQYPAEWAPPNMEFVVVWPDAAAGRIAADSLSAALGKLFRSRSSDGPRVTTSRTICPGSVNLVLIGDLQDLAQASDFRDVLRVAESNGVRFKLAKLSSLSKPYPAQNIAYDMLQISGGRTWMPAETQPAFCSMDAGHDKDARRSRWAKVETDEQQIITKVRVFDTSLAEHVPKELVDDMWPSQSSAIVCRDGRLAQERFVIEDRAKAEGRQLIEAKKSPKAILWRVLDSRYRVAQFGDAVVDDHDEILLQTVAQNAIDYIRPVRLTLHGGEAMELATSFLHQQAMPGLSLFRMARLPGSLYFADLVSKLTQDGWPKVVGRGFVIPQVIP